MIIRYVFLLAALVAFQASAQTPSTGSGQASPNRPLRLVTGYPPGGSADFLSRIAADEISKEPVSRSQLIPNARELA
jgi:tripartite-type tricarboxylate transporter receptor subunit TctC